jgi:hypothetical protein
MNLDQLRKRLTGGFRPFTVCLSDGRKLPVPHPEFVAVGRNVVVLIGPDDFANVIDPIHIVTLEQKVAEK